MNGLLQYEIHQVYLIDISKEKSKTPRGHSKLIGRRKTVNAMGKTKQKSRNDKQAITVLHIKLQTERHEPTTKLEVNSGAPKRLTAPALCVIVLPQNTYIKIGVFPFI